MKLFKLSSLIRQFISSYLARLRFAVKAKLCNAESNRLHCVPIITRASDADCQNVIALTSHVEDRVIFRKPTINPALELI